MSSDRLRLVVAISDLTDGSDIVVRYAAHIAACTNASLRVVHPIGAIGESLRKVLFGDPPLDERIRMASSDLADQVARITAETGITCDAVLDHNRPDQVLIRQSIYGLADIVVAGAGSAAGTVSLRTLGGVRTPCLFVPANLERTGSRLVIQAMTPRVAPEAFLRAQRWMRILRSLPLHQPVLSADTLELDVLLCPVPGNTAHPTQTLLAADALRRTLGNPAPGMVVGLIDTIGSDDEQAFSQAMHELLLAEAPCPVLYMPPLAAVRSVPDPTPLDPLPA